MKSHTITLPCWTAECGKDGEAYRVYVRAPDAYIAEVAMVREGFFITSHTTRVFDPDRKRRHQILAETPTLGAEDTP